MKQPPARAQAAVILQQVLQQGRSLTAALAPVDHPEQAFVQALCYEVCRYYPRLERILQQLLNKPLADKHTDIRCLLAVGVYELMLNRRPAHAVVAQTVEAVQSFRKPWAKGLVNGVLRNYQRRGQAIADQFSRDTVYQWAHPAWLIHRLQSDWPEQAAAILEANNAHPPMSLRVNRRLLTRETYLHRLTNHQIPARPLASSGDAVMLDKAVDVTALPGFDKGEVSVQDEAAQLAAGLLELQDGHYVLDACAAPGGKTGHIAEYHQGTVVALDKDADRAALIQSNLQRLGCADQVRCVVGDAARPQTWHSGDLFDRILLDAPCSATGVIRRHPDIKLLRRDADIASLQRQQSAMLDALWPLLKPGGILLYCTCSVLKDENEDQLNRFLERTPRAKQRHIHAPWGHASQVGRQIFPGEQGMDGFYYGRVEKIG